MESSARRILLAVEPRFLEGALATLLSSRLNDEVVQLSQSGTQPSDTRYDVAVVSVELPDGVHADVVITLPDTQGSAGTGTIKRGNIQHEVTISEGEQLIDLIEQYVPAHTVHP